MENTGYIGLSYQIALDRKMDIVANNIANINTTGYKSSHMQFAEELVRAKGQNPMSMVLDYGNYKDFTPGAMQQTDNPLDVAVQGNGFLAVQTADGLRYTRNGAMQLNGTGQLVNSMGQPFASTGGQPITIPAGSKEVIVANDGTVSTEQGAIGQLKVVRFAEPQNLNPVGDNLYDTQQSEIADNLGSQVKQGMLEGSNVNAVVEMTDMIEVQRKYESVARLLQSDHEMQTSMIQSFSRLQ